MDDALPTEAQVQALVPDMIFRRGERYCERGNILELARRDGVLYASITGSDGDPYAVSIAARGDRITAQCDCRYARDTDSWCKHVVAVLLAVARGHQPVGEQPSVGALLAPMDREELVRMIERMVKHAPRLYGTVSAIVLGREEGGRPG